MSPTPPLLPATATRHAWNFFRTGGLDQVALTTAADLLALRTLDQKLWVALSCPVKGLELDEKTLALIDADGDGRIRVPELIAAVEWAAARLKDPAALLRGVDTTGNACPSLHVAIAIYTGFWMHSILRTVRAGAVLHTLSWAWSLAIVYSTLATKQHVVWDVVGGLLLLCTK